MQTFTQSQKYQGFTNYPTWLIGTYIDNDFDLNTEVLDLIFVAKHRFQYEIDSIHYLKAELESLFEEYLQPEDNPLNPSTPYQINTDLLRWALEKVDFMNLAEHYLDYYGN